MKIEELETKLHIEVLLRRVYGNELFYPTSKDALAICSLMEVKTITKEKLKFCRDQGWGVIIRTEEYKLD